MSLSESVDFRGNASEPDRLPGVIPDAARHAAMLEHPTLAVATIERGRIRSSNTPWKALFAMPPDVSIESHVATLFPNAASADRFERGLQSELLSGRGARTTARLEHMLVRRDGQAFLAEVVVSSPRPGVDSGALSGDAVWQVRDITVERTLRRELRDLEEYHRELSRHQSDVTFVIDRKGRISYASSSIEGVLGYRVAPLLGQPFASLLDPAQATEVEQWLRSQSRRAVAAQDVETGDGIRVRLVRDDGTIRSLSCKARDCFAVPRIAGMVVQARPPAVVDHVANAALRAELIALAGEARVADEAGIASVLDAVVTRIGATFAVLWRTVDGTMQAMAMRGAPAIDGATALAARPPPLLDGANAAMAAGLRVVDDVHAHPGIGASDREAFAAASVGALVQVPLPSRDASDGWLVVGADAARPWSDAVVDFVVGAALVVGSLRNEVDAPAATAAPDAADAAAADPLTRLPGRTSGLQRLATCLGGLRASETLVVVVAGIDRLRDVNDLHGLAAGDAALVRLARLLDAAAGSPGFVARIGGDEFVVVLQAATVADGDARLQAVIDATNAFGTDDPACSASVGIARFAFDGTDAAGLVLQADLALREAKAVGRNEALTYHHKLAMRLKARRELDAEIETALANDEFTLFYQPQVSLADGRIVGLEALLRWQHPVRGLLLPSAFIESAFTLGLHDAITKRVLMQVCEQLAAWRRAGDVPEIPVAVNVEGRQFHDRRLPALVASALLKSGLPARLLLLDVKEQSLAVGDAGLARVVRELSRLGVRVAVSDFSVGHASFRSLRQLQVAQIKLDGGFVGCLPDDAESAMVVASFVALAHRLKYPVVAEGVETRAQFEHLRELGCEAGQGFYFGAPLSAAEIRPHLTGGRLAGLAGVA